MDIANFCDNRELRSDLGLLSDTRYDESRYAEAVDEACNEIRDVLRPLYRVEKLKLSALTSGTVLSPRPVSKLSKLISKFSG